MTRAEVRERLSDLKAVYPREFGFMDVEQKKRLLDIWAREFADVPCKDFDTAIDEAKRRYKRLLSLAEIRDLLSDSNGLSNKGPTLDEWIRMLQFRREQLIEIREDEKQTIYTEDVLEAKIADVDRKILEAMQRKGMIT